MPPEPNGALRQNAARRRAMEPGTWASGRSGSRSAALISEMLMSLMLGIFDVFTYAIPGSLYLLLGAYVATRLGWVNIGDLNTSPSIVLIAAIIIASYLVGHVTYPMGSNLGHVLPLWRRSIDDARDEFTRRVPAAAERPYVRADLSLLQAMAENQQREVAQEITPLRAVGLMVRNCSV